MPEDPGYQSKPSQSISLNVAVNLGDLVHESQHDTEAANQELLSERRKVNILETHRDVLESQITTLEAQLASMTAKLAAETTKRRSAEANTAADQEKKLLRSLTVFRCKGAGTGTRFHLRPKCGNFDLQPLTLCRNCAGDAGIDCD